MLRGNYSRPGAGICPMRGHSNALGNRIVGIDEKALRQGVEQVYGFVLPAQRGHDAGEDIDRSTFPMRLGGGLAVAMADPRCTLAAVRRLEMAMHNAPKPNRPHLLVGKHSRLLPCMGTPSWTCR